MFGFEDEEPNSLAFQEQLADRFLEKVVTDLGGNRQIETPVRFVFFEDVVVQDELSQGPLKVVDV